MPLLSGKGKAGPVLPLPLSRLPFGSHRPELSLMATQGVSQVDLKLFHDWQDEAGMVS